MRPQDIIKLQVKSYKWGRGHIRRYEAKPVGQENSKTDHSQKKVEKHGSISKNTSIVSRTLIPFRREFDLPGFP